MATNFGFIALDHLMADKVNKANYALVDTAIRESLAEYNRQKVDTLASFVRVTTNASERFRLPGSGTLQPLDAEGWGNPLVVNEQGHYDVAFPIHGAGDAFGFNRVTKAISTIADVDRELARVMRDDADWIRRHVLAAIFYNQTWSFVDIMDPAAPTLTIEPLANGDTVTYNFVGGSAPATDDHYLHTTYALTGGNGSQFQTIFSELSEHPGNGPDEVVVFMGATQRTQTEVLGSSFYPVPISGIAQGANTAQFISAAERYQGPGDEVFGKIHRCVVVEWKNMPANYLIGLALNTEPPLAMREYPAAGLQGLFQENASPDGNLQETRFLRYAGFGARNRVAACVFELSAAGASYTGPAGYKVMPLPV